MEDTTIGRNNRDKATRTGITASGVNGPPIGTPAMMLLFGPRIPLGGNGPTALDLFIGDGPSGIETLLDAA